MGKLKTAFVNSFKEALPLALFSAAFREAMPVRLFLQSFRQGWAIFFSPFVAFWAATRMAIWAPAYEPSPSGLTYTHPSRGVAAE